MNRIDLPVSDRLEQPPEVRLREGAPFPAASAGFRADVLAFDAVYEDGFQRTAQQVGLGILTGNRGVSRHVPLLQGFDGLCDLVFDPLQGQRGWSIRRRKQEVNREKVRPDFLGEDKTPSHLAFWIKRKI